LVWSEGEPDSPPSFLAGYGWEPREFGSGSSFSRRQLDVKWVYDSSDDPLFPSDGVTLAAGLELSDLELTEQVPRDPSALEPQPLGELPDSDAHLVAAAVSGQKTWLLTPHQAASASLRVSVGRSSLKDVLVRDELIEAEVTAFEITAGLRHSTPLWGFERARRLGELRLETNAHYGYEVLSPQVGSGAVGRFQLGTGLAFRNRWGLFRFGLSYINFIGEER
ncbi:MAG TPA: hypothetical protein VHN15_01455, partial [Thermoanaerobaculia bacterium]|nr:hypothetical protein [Thermoanaerobaculia bacterium]